MPYIFVILTGPLTKLACYVMVQIWEDGKVMKGILSGRQDSFQEDKQKVLQISDNS